ncbi:hypothetical protein [Jannaschia seohaensis]|uniref:Uncharacterized protein n=1 Tax=Jannaschia seohaensis TaxID=475081 RepID=A0A2Y9AQ62_9RHOB|nr:hypothetical protein [Jannaschia seohaensis]PWJ20481.1 hypothetical protein BCF38_103299 [Jannaschia seohaensis]SSA44577.1 hypothetical protein SAMN05421539_103299 [Jannaschia seohaensis]
MLDLPRPETPQATLALLSDVQSRIDALSQEANALRAHLLRLADEHRQAPPPSD